MRPWVATAWSRCAARSLLTLRLTLRLTLSLTVSLTLTRCGTQPPGAEGLYERLALSLAHADPARPLTPGERVAPLLLLDGFKSIEVK